MYGRFVRFWMALGLALLWGSVLHVGTGWAQGARIIESEVDPSLFRIDEVRYLGAKPDPALTFRDQNGVLFTFEEMTRKPLILVLSYFGCDGTCSLVNSDLVEQLKGVQRLVAGEDFQILTVSFDPKDTKETLAAFLKKFDIPEPLRAAWRFGLPAGGDEARRLAGTIGFKYFWSPRDQVFLHPGIFGFFSSDGRIVRYLYAMNTNALDVELALISAKLNQIKPGEIMEIALSLCYSYNYAEGRYTLNYAFFVGFGSLVFGVLALVVSILAYRRRARA